MFPRFTTHYFFRRVKAKTKLIIFNTKVNVKTFKLLNSLSCSHWASCPLHCDLCRVWCVRLLCHFVSFHWRRPLPLLCPSSCKISVKMEKKELRIVKIVMLQLIPHRRRTIHLHKLAVFEACTHFVKVIKQHVEEDGVWQCEAHGPARIAAVCVQ